MKQLHTIWAAAEYRKILPVKTLINNIIKRPAKTLLERLHSAKLINKERIEGTKVYELLKGNIDVICKKLFTSEAIKLGSEEDFNPNNELGYLLYSIKSESYD